LAPASLVLLLEAALRLASFGYPTSFLLHSTIKGKQVFIQNDRFGWRFFGPALARQPFPFAIPREKPSNTVRIFVFGESAAYGDPQPEFGVGRMLQAMLSLRYPGARFEIINAAMTGINSHVILPIARDCTRAQGDIWLVYMGNNEVVGPFGAGTVFGPQSPSLPLIRATVALKATRTGQLLDAALRFAHPTPQEKEEWGGMLMFLGHQVRQDDPRMKAVYEGFNRNLNDIVKLGHASGAGVVLATVAVNLRDCAPFASLPNDSLPEGVLSDCHDAFLRGLAEQKAGRHNEALGLFRQVSEKDPGFADVQFATAESLTALGQKQQAQSKFSLARDLDALRFRCDSHLNEIIRQCASAQEQRGVVLADAEAAFERQAEVSSGEALFYEHVHLTFEGNYLLARTCAEQVVKLLPEAVQRRADPQRPWPSVNDCARRLGWTDFQRLGGINEMLGRLSDPPFTAQLNHSAEVERLSRLAAQLRPHSEAAARQGADLLRESLSAWPDDPILYQELIKVCATTGDVKGAVEAARRMTDLLPNATTSWMLLGDALARNQAFEEAIQAFTAALDLDLQNVWAVQSLAQTYERMGKTDDAIREYRRSLQLKPRLGSAWLALGQLQEKKGQQAEAQESYQMALKNRIHRATDLAVLAQFCQNRGWFEAAATNYCDASKLNPSDPLLLVKAGQCFSALGRTSEAEQQYLEAIRVAPDHSGQAHFLLGLSLGRRAKPAEATEQFREAVRLMPNVVEARVNLAIALLDQGRTAEALEEFHEVLRQSPTNAVALRNVSALEGKQ
jgi:tetratricopeptide (TPR) repeat protein